MKFFKGATFLFIIMVIFLTGALSVSAADINNTTDDHISQCALPLSTPDFNNNTNTADLNSIHSINEINNGNSTFNNQTTEQINSSANLLHGIEIPNLFNSSAICNITKVSDNIFSIKTTDNEYNLYRMYIDSKDSYRDAIDRVTFRSNIIDDIKIDILLLDFKENLKIDVKEFHKFENRNHEKLPGKYAMYPRNIKNLIIRGFNAKLCNPNPDEREEYHLINIDPDVTVTMNNITIQGFNTAIYNYGILQPTNVTFEKNRINYLFDKDFGGAIKNYGITTYNKCTFKDNYAKYGGAVYNELGSQSVFMNCIFKNNKAYGSHKYILKTNDNNNIYSCKGASCLVLNDNDGDRVIEGPNNTQQQINDPSGNTYIASINSTEQLYEFLFNYAHEEGRAKCIYLNLENKTYNIDYKILKEVIGETLLNYKNIQMIYIMGNDATINLLNNNRKNMCHFIQINPGSNCFISDITLKGFNTDIKNYGTTTIINSNLKVNKCDYKIKKDYGGAIYNEGMLHISNSNFTDGYAKYGGAIYNSGGIISCVNTLFENNVAYADGGAIYNKKGLITCNNCTFKSNTAKKGGSVYNYYGSFIDSDNYFYKSKAQEGGAIYNDFGKTTINNNTFKDCSASKKGKGDEILNYGKDASSIITGDSQVIKGNKITTLKANSDAPNEYLRWTIKIGEIGLSTALVIGSGVIGLSPLSAFIMCGLGGAILAGGEKAIEGIYMDHNFNFYNCALMAAISGTINGIIGASIAGLKPITNPESIMGGVSESSKVFDEEVHNMMCAAARNALDAKITFGMLMGLDAIANIVTEIIPPINLNSYKLPSTITDLNKGNSQNSVRMDDVKQVHLGIDFDDVDKYKGKSTKEIFKHLNERNKNLDPKDSNYKPFSVNPIHFYEQKVVIW